MTDADFQADELLALTSIYDEAVITVSNRGTDVGGQFEAYLQLPDSVSIQVPVKSHQQAEKGIYTVD